MAPGATVTPWAVLIAGVVVTLRLFRWRGLLTVREPLLLILHVGYGWLALGLLLLSLNGVHEMLPAMKQKPPEEWMRKFDAIEHRFAPHARIAALLVLLSGLYIIYKTIYGAG